MFATQRTLHERCRHPTGVFRAFGPRDVEQSIPARFAQLARRHPARPAVATRSRTLTYEALDRAANRVAHAVMARQRPDDLPTALLFEHGSSAIVAILGALKAGTSYVFLDPTLPPARLVVLLEDAQATALVTNTKNLPLARAVARAGGPVIDVDALDPWTSEEDPARSLGPDTPFSLIYTSGSTGQPKGVLQNHRNVLDTIGKYANNLHICPDDRLALLASCSFNTSLLGIFGALLNGAAVHPFDLKAEGVARLAAWLGEEEITIYHSVPTVFRQLLDTLTREARFPALRALCLGGEAVYRRDVERYRQHFGPECPLVHGFGSTELSMIRQFFVDGQTPLPDRLVPVGYPIEDREVLILDEGGKLVAAGETGEIVLRSRYLALGYWRRPELTRQAFLPDPDGGGLRRYHTGDLGRVTSDGCLTHLGRQDLQVKVRGHRIELPEVELALLELPGVREAVVTARENHLGELQLIAYVVATAAPPPEPSALRAGLAEKLPDYMVPSVFVPLDELPQTDTGKVDRRALPPPPAAGPSPGQPFAPPGTHIERELAEIWAEVLGLDRVGIHDDFLALGGDSLRATQVISRVQGLLGADIALRAFFEAGTIAEIAAIITNSRPVGRRA